MTIRLEEVIDSTIFYEILQKFSRVTKMAAVAVNYKGEPITDYSYFTDFCAKFRENDICLAHCYKSDAHGGVEAARSGKPYIYKCHTGLTDIAVPIVEDGHYLGAILAGQVLIEDEDNAIDHSSCLPVISERLQEKELLDARQKVPVITRKQLNAASDLLYVMANYIVEKTINTHVQEELNEKNEKLIRSMSRRMELEKNLQESELKLLQSQVNPHFLFNVLNTIHSLAMIEEAPKTSEMACNLSEMLRYTIQNKMHHLVTLKEEIEYTQKYISIQETRNGDLIQYNFDIPEELNYIKIPFMIIQPFVSNAIKHGIYGYREKGEISISAEEISGDCYIYIEDNGIGMSKEVVDSISIYEKKYSETKSTGIGISNTNKRLIHVFGEDYKLRIKSKESVGTQITIRVPL